MSEATSSISESQNQDDFIGGSLLVVCGETSSDEHTAAAIAYLKSVNPHCEVFGMGGAHLKEAGMELVVDARKSASVMGLTEVFWKLADIYRAYKKLLVEVKVRNTKVALLVDFPDFNLRLAKDLKSQGVLVYYFISPQLWAWRTGRIKTIKAYIDQMFSIFPFEEEFYRGHGVISSYVGHPFLDRPPTEIAPSDFLKKYGIPDGKRLVALLPGSRKAEIERILPVLLEVVKEFSDDPYVHFLIPMASSVESLFDTYGPFPESCTFISGYAREILEVSDAAIVTSGTATIEAALSGVPFCIAYRVSRLTYLVGKALIKGVKFVGMPNIILNRLLVKEYLQDDCNSEALYEETKLLLYDAAKRKELIEGLSEVRKKLERDSEETVGEILGENLLQALKEVSHEAR